MPYINKSFFPKKQKAVFTLETHHPSKTGYPLQNPCQIDDLNDVKNRTVSTLIKVVIWTDCIRLYQWILKRVFFVCRGASARAVQG